MKLNSTRVRRHPFFFLIFSLTHFEYDLRVFWTEKVNGRGVA